MALEITDQKKKKKKRQMEFYSQDEAIKQKTLFSMNCGLDFTLLIFNPNISISMTDEFLQTL